MCSIFLYILISVAAKRCCSFKTSSPWSSLPGSDVSITCHLLPCFGVFGFLTFIYLSGCTRSWLWHTGSFLFAAECSIFSFGIWTLSCSLWDPVPWQGIKPQPPALGAWILSHWKTREVPLPCLLIMEESWEVASLYLPKLEMKVEMEMSCMSLGSRQRWAGAFACVVSFVLHLTVGSTFIRPILWMRKPMLNIIMEFLIVTLQYLCFFTLQLVTCFIWRHSCDCLS